MFKHTQSLSKLHQIKPVHQRTVRVCSQIWVPYKAGCDKRCVCSLSRDSCKNSHFFLLPACCWWAVGCYSIVVCWWYEPPSSRSTWGCVCSIPGLCSSFLFQQAWFNVGFNSFRNGSLAKSCSVIVLWKIILQLLCFSFHRCFLVLCDKTKGLQLLIFAIGCNAVRVQRSHCVRYFLLRVNIKNFITQ